MRRRFVLVGIYKVDEFSDSERTYVCTFSSLKLAEEYIAASRLKTPRYGYGYIKKPFRAKSLLACYSDCEIETYSYLRHNPKINW